MGCYEGVFRDRGEQAKPVDSMHLINLRACYGQFTILRVVGRLVSVLGCSLPEWVQLGMSTSSSLIYDMPQNRSVKCGVNVADVRPWVHSVDL